MNISPKARVAPPLGLGIVMTVAEHQVSVLLDDMMAIELFRRDRVRDPVQRTKPLRGGDDRDLVSERSASATRPSDSDSAPCLYQRARRPSKN